MPLVSIVMPVFNAAGSLPNSITSVLTQTLEDIELICVDDCSTDDSVQIINDFSMKDARVKLIQQDINQGPGSARNKGIEKAQGRYVAFLDSDDTFTPYAMELLSQKGAHSKAEMIGGNLCWREANGDIIVPAPFQFLFHEEGIFRVEDYPSLWLPWHHCRYLYLKEFLQNNEISYLPGGRIGEDSYMAAKSLSAADKIYVCPHTVYLQSRNREMRYQEKYRPHWIEYLQNIVLIFNTFSEAGLTKQAYLFINCNSKGLFNAQNWQDFPEKKLVRAREILSDFFANFDVEYAKRHDFSPYGNYDHKIISKIEQIRENNFSKLSSGHKTKKTVPSTSLTLVENFNLLAARLDAVYNTRSWKITAPLRKLERALKRFRQKL